MAGGRHGQGEGGLLMWTGLPEVWAGRLLAAAGAGCDQTHPLLRSLLGLEGEEEEEEEALVLLDLYHYAVVFAAREGFSPEKLSVLFSLVVQTHARAVSTPADNLEGTLAFCKETLLRHSVHRPPFMAQVFTLQDGKKIFDYMLTTYFRHFKLYKAVFTAEERLSLTLSYSDEPPAPLPPPGLSGEAGGEGEGVPGDAGSSEGGAREDFIAAAQDDKEAEQGAEPGEPHSEPVAQRDGADPAAGFTAAVEVDLESEQARDLQALVEASLQGKLTDLKADITNRIARQHEELSAAVSQLETTVLSKAKK